MPIKKVNLRLPDDPELLQAIGRVALAHAQLEHTLRMTIKTLTRMKVRETLLTTQESSARNLREAIRRIFKYRCVDNDLNKKLKALLNRANNLSIRRNQLIHRPWAANEAGQVVVKDGEHNWGAPPTAGDLKRLATELVKLADEFNSERLKGFIKKAAEMNIVTKEAGA